MALQFLNTEHILSKKNPNQNHQNPTLLSFISRTAYFGMGQGNPILIFSNRKVLLWVNFCQNQGNDFSAARIQCCNVIRTCSYYSECYADCNIRQKKVLTRNILNYNKSVSSGDNDELAHFVKWQSHRILCTAYILLH